MRFFELFDDSINYIIANYITDTNSKCRRIKIFSVSDSENMDLIRSWLCEDCSTIFVECQLKLNRKLNCFVENEINGKRIGWSSLYQNHIKPIIFQFGKWICVNIEEFWILNHEPIVILKWLKRRKVKHTDI